MDSDTLQKFFRGTTSEQEERRIVDWLEQDPANEVTFNDERRLYDTCLLLDRERRSASTRRRDGFSVWAGELARMAAVLAACVVVFGYLYARMEKSYRSQENSISVPTGQYLDLTLPDGTKVTLNGSSTITSPAVFSGGTRHVRLSGEAFFDVAHDPDRPFVVQTAYCDVEVLGTQFNVEAYPDSGEFTASLLRGRVKVVGHGEKARSVVLSPNERVRFSGGGFEVEKIPEHEHFLWREGLVAFREAAFAELMAQFEKYYGVQIVYDRENLPPEKFSGKIRISDGIDHAFWILQQNSSFTYQKDMDSKIITIN